MSLITFCPVEVANNSCKQIHVASQGEPNILQGFEPSVNICTQLKYNCD